MSGAPRCWLFCGFPCQPLSVQGDQRGEGDERADVFKAAVRSAWEQHSCGLLLDCLPAALQAPYVQMELQKLGWSLGLQIEQKILDLHLTWPNRRTRWWASMIPRQYELYDLGQLPHDPEMRKLSDNFPNWPVWPNASETMLELTQDELEIYNDPQFGTDDRYLQKDKAAPCILHSYGAALQPCPCGCRGLFSWKRLQRDGVRGFFVFGKHGRERFLHVQEAAFLSTIRPSMIFPDGPRNSLCLVGQCAAPLQALWVLGRVLEMNANNIYGTAKNAIDHYKLMLRRDAHNHFAATEMLHLTMIWHLDESPFPI